MARTWLITGTSSGFGRILTERLLERGDRVAATLRDPARLDDLRARHGDALWVRRLDVTDTAQVRTIVDAAFAELGRVDVVVSNAGYGLIGAAEELTDAQIERQLNTNVVGSIQLIRAALPHLRAQGGGRILQLSSIGGLVAFPGGSLYHASKWAMEGFVESVRAEVASFGIEASLVEPGSARTDFSGRSLDLADAHPDYAGTPLDHVRSIVVNRTRDQIPGDPVKMADAMIAAAASPEPLPLRLLLGSDAYTLAHATLTARVAALEAQRDLALSTDADDYTATAGGGLGTLRR